MRDAITTALTLDLLQRNCDKVTMACNAQTINVLNSLILTEGDRTILTPNYDVFMMYKAHRGMTALDVARNDSEDSAVYTFASRNEDGTQLLINLTNAHMNDGAEVLIRWKRLLPKIRMIATRWSIRIWCALMPWTWIVP